MRHPYCWDLNNPESWLYPIELIGPDGHKGEDQRTIHMPEGPDRLFCITDSVMYATRTDIEGNLHYHEHQMGWEDFFVDSGSMDLYINDKKVFVTVGDIIHLQPYEAHGMFFHSPVKYRGFMHGLPNSDNSPVGAVLREKNPDAMKDPAYPRDRIGIRDIYMREPPLFEECAAEKCSSIRNIKRPMATFALDGVSMKMISARWENGGVCEMWAADMQKGFSVKSDPYIIHPDLFYITSGQVKFTVYGEEFIAGPECVVKAPKLSNYTIEALSDAVMYDVGGVPRWYAYLQDRSSVMQNDPERAKDAETLKSLREKFFVQWII